MDNETYIRALLEKYLAKTATEQERATLFAALAANRYDSQWEQLMTEFSLQAEKDPAYRPGDWEPVIRSILLHQQQGKPAAVVQLYRRIFYWSSVAALLLLTAGTLVWHFRKQENPPIIAVSPLHDALPGKSGAVLTLADGRQVVLDSAGNGVIATQNGTKVLLKSGQLVYDATEKTATATVYNTMTTPKGRQYQVILPDGTKVWLNAASRLTYPTAFIGSERKVSITGEAYFEVKHNAKMPFKVTVNGNTEVEVLGTHFNINAYSDEANIKTTLLEGSVKVSAAGHSSLITSNSSLVLRPGQQADVKPDGALRIVNNADVEQVVAWKNGLFSFRDADIETVMRQLARWYNVEVRYEGNLPKREFNGEMGQTLTLDQVLKGLTKTRVHYRIENGNQLIILP